MTIKYKVSDVAKDLNVPAKQIIDLLAAQGAEPKKTGASLTEAELNLVFERFTQKNAEKNLDGYLSSQPKAQPKAGEVLKKADGTVVEMKNTKKKQDKKPAEPQMAVVKREVVTKVVDTRTVDVNLDRFNEKFDELASTKNVENRRTPQPAGSRQKAAVEISRNGTKAAAVTWGNVRTTALFPPVSVVLNRPFVYAVVDQESGLPLFLGSVNCLT